MTKWKKPQEWKSGAAIIIVSRLRKGILSISAAIASSPSGLERWAPFGVPVVPEVRITKRGLSGGGLSSDSAPAAISCSSVVSAGASPSSIQPTTAGRPSRRRLPAGRRTPRRRRAPSAPRACHLDQLRAGEHRVQVERAGAELGGGQGRLDEAAVVAAHDPDAVAEADSHRLEGVGEGVGAAVEPLEAERPPLVDDGDLVGVMDRRGGDAGRRRGPPAQEGDADLRALSGRIGSTMPASCRTFTSKASRRRCRAASRRCR